MTDADIPMLLYSDKAEIILQWVEADFVGYALKAPGHWSCTIRDEELIAEDEYPYGAGETTIDAIVEAGKAYQLAREMIDTP